jgi:type VI secretion system secreted protein VgrG
VGQRKTDSISQSYVIEVGENLRLVCGESILELNASGQINLTGVQISFYASGDAEFNTGGVLHLNNGGGAGATPDGQGVKASIDANINAAFPKPKG